MNPTLSFPPPLFIFFFCSCVRTNSLSVLCRASTDVTPTPPLPTPPSQPPFITVMGGDAIVDLWKVGQCHREPRDLLRSPFDSHYQPPLQWLQQPYLIFIIFTCDLFCKHVFKKGGKRTLSETLKLLGKAFLCLCVCVEERGRRDDDDDVSAHD